MGRKSERGGKVSACDYTKMDDNDQKHRLSFLGYVFITSSFFLT